MRRRELLAGGAVAAIALAETAHADLPNERRIVTNAHTIEQTLAVAYGFAIQSGALSQTTATALSKLANDAAVWSGELLADLRGLGGTPLPKPPRAAYVPIPGFPFAKTEEEYLRALMKAETSAVNRWYATLPQLDDEKRLALGAKLMAGAGLHLAELRTLLGDDPLPNAFETGA